MCRSSEDNIVHVRVNLREMAFDGFDSIHMRDIASSAAYRKLEFTVHAHNIAKVLLYSNEIEIYIFFIVIILRFCISGLFRYKLNLVELDICCAFVISPL